jgi:uncharacterized membrane-anchored protein
LFGYVVKGIRGIGITVNADAAMALSVPFIAVGVWYLLKRWRDKLLATMKN